VFIIVVVALLTAVFLRFAGDWIGIAAFIWYAFIPFIGPRRVRARWAISSILFSGLLGLAMATLNLLRHSGILVVNRQTDHVIAYYGSFVHGLILGIMSVLLISGQMLGAKREEKETSHEPSSESPSLTT
jgi:hypothetical protein